MKRFVMPTKPKGLSLWGAIFALGYVLPVLFQQGISVISAGTVRRRDIVLFGFQPVNDLFDGPLIRLPAFGVKVAHYLVQTLNANLCVVNKIQYAPTNCWRFRDSAVPSPMPFIL